MDELDLGITFNDLKEWAATKPGDEVVGIACSSYECPIAYFLTDLNPAFSGQLRVYPWDDSVQVVVGWEEGDGEYIHDRRLAKVVQQVDERGSRMPVRASDLAAIIALVEGMEE